MKKSRRYFLKTFILYSLYIVIVFLFSNIFLNSNAKINRFLKQNDISYSEYFYTFPKNSPIDEYRIYKIKINENSLSKYKKIKTPYLLKSLYYRLEENDVYESELKFF